MLLKEMEIIVNNTLVSFQTDFYDYDRPRVEKYMNHTYIWSLRQSGTDLTDLNESIFKGEFIKSLKNKTAQEREVIAHKELNSYAYLVHERNDYFFLIKDEKLKRIEKSKALSHIVRTIKNQIDNA